MKNGEFTKGDLLVDPDMEVDLENGTVTACLETWFDVDEKFGLHTADEDHTWVNLYASYTPGTGAFQMEYVISREDSEEWREYNPRGRGWHPGLGAAPHCVSLPAVQELREPLLCGCLHPGETGFPASDRPRHRTHRFPFVGALRDVFRE